MLDGFAGFAGLAGLACAFAACAGGGSSSADRTNSSAAAAGSAAGSATATATATGSAAGSSAQADAEPPWPVPTGWRTEVIKFPLDFAPSIAHRGQEVLRFPPGFLDPTAGAYWSYAFVWRTEDAAQLDATALGGELTAYFRGLIDAVDEKQRITARDQITARATADGAGRFRLAAHVFDAFKTAAPLDLTGTAERRPCRTGALWVFVLAPEKSAIRPQLEELARAASCAH
jgi:hypothetical protein